MSKQHYSSIDVASFLAKSNWGREFKTKKAAEQALVENPAEIAAWGIMEFLRRLNALGDSGKSDREDKRIEKPDNAKRFPDKKPGDFVYSGELEEGFTKYIVVSVDSDGFALVVSCNAEIGDCLWSGQASVACDWHFASEREAVIAAAQNDIEYHEKRLERARKALSACEASGDLTEFMQPSDE